MSVIYGKKYLLSSFQYAEENNIWRDFAEILGQTQCLVAVQDTF